jgi:type IV secretory pathway TraG/TraD family ATPase VirD4
VLVLATFVVLLISPSLIAAAGLVAAATATACIRHARGRADRHQPAPHPGDGATTHGKSSSELNRATLLGTSHRGRPFHLTDHQLSAHALVLGASGAGKTTTMLTILTDRVRRGQAVIAIDMKGSPGFASELAAAADGAGRPFHIWTLDGPEHWNPLARGNATELKDRLISAERWTEPHYQRAAERYAQTVLQVWQHARPDRAPTIRDVVGMMDHHRLVAMLRDVPGPLAERVQDYLVTLGADQLSAVRGLQTRLAIIAESHTGAYLEPAGPGTLAPDCAGVIGPERPGTIDPERPGTIDLDAVLRDGEVVVFSLNSSRYGKLAAQVGALVVQDLTSAVGRRLDHDSGTPAMIAIDELSALGAEHVLNLYARGRESAVPVIAATQELADLERAARGLRDQLIGITGVKIAHRQDVPSSAVTIAEIAGTERVWEQTLQTDRRALLPSRDTGRGSRRQVDRYRVEPDTIKTLATGHAVVISKLPTASVQTVRVNRPRPSRPLARE